MPPPPPRIPKADSKTVLFPFGNVTNFLPGRPSSLFDQDVGLNSSSSSSSSSSFFNPEKNNKISPPQKKKIKTTSSDSSYNSFFSSPTESNLIERRDELIDNLNTLGQEENEARS